MTETDNAVTHHVDVVVVGAGTMGAMTLWQLARRGVSCVAVEQFGIAHDRGAAGGDTRFFRSIYKEGAGYMPLLRRALQLWKELEAETSSRLFTRTGALYLDDDAADSIDALAAMAAASGVDHETLGAGEIRARFPQHPVTDDQRGLFDPGAGYIRADRAIASALSRAQELGAKLVLNDKVRSVTPDETGVTVETTHSRFRAKRVVLTPGPWDALLPEEFRRHLDIAKVMLTWYLPRDPSEYAVGKYVSVVREGGRFFGLPSNDGETIKFGDTSLLESHIDPDSLDRTVTLADLAATDEAVARYLPGVIPTTTRASIHHEAFTDDHNPIIGSLDEPRLIFGCGFSGHGFKLAPTFGEVLAELAVVGASTHDIRFLSPQRFAHGSIPEGHGTKDLGA
jgi:sarcosine oxidase